MSEAERTLVLIKPDAVRRGLSGEIIARLERRGLKVVALKMLRMGQALAQQHYAIHRGKPFYEGLVSFITSGPVVAAIFQGPGAVEAVRQAMGTTDPLKAAPGSIRGDLGLDILHNLIHGSDSLETAEKEMALFFRPEEMAD